METLRQYYAVFLTISILPYGFCKQGTFWQVTDFHYDNTYPGEAVSCYKDVPVSQQGVLGNQWCDSPWQLIQSAISAMRDIEPNPDFIIWTGDSIFHTRAPEKDLNETLVLELIQNLTTTLKAAFPDTPIYPTLGNHDYYPKHLLPGSSNRLYQAIADIWLPLTNTTDTRNTGTMQTGGYYSQLISEGLRIVALNTNLYYYSNVNNENLTDPADQFSWLDNVLTKVASDKEKAIIIGHVPPGIKTMKDFPWYFPHYNTRFLAVLKKHADVIPAMYFGHDHKDTFKFITIDETPVIPIFLAPSVTPWRKVTKLTEAPAHNPAVRLVAYDRATGEPQEISQFFMDLTNPSEWNFLYNFTSVYHTRDASASSLLTAWQSFSEQPDNLHGYFGRIFVNATPFPNCNQECKTRLLCAIRFHEKSTLTACEQKKSNLGIVKSVNPQITVSVFTVYAIVHFTYH